MKVVLESSSLFFKQYTGIPYYILNLCNGLENIADIDLVLGFRLKKITKKNRLSKTLLSKERLWHGNNFILSSQKIEVAHSSHTPFLNLNRALKVATIHDLAVHLPQFENYHFASDYFKNKRLRLFKEFSTKADVLIAVSEATKRDFLNFFTFPEDKIHVIPLAPSINKPLESSINEDFFLKQLNVDRGRFFLSTGGISLRKNSLNLIKAFLLCRSQSDYKLIITGKIEAEQYKLVSNFIIKNKLDEKVIITKYLSTEELSTLYKNAKAFLFPTFYEGFGIPILEAMLHKLPVLTSNIGAAPETAGGFAVLTDPFSPESIADGIDKLQSIQAETLVEAKRFAEKHTWNKTAEMTYNLYQKYL
ncbi:MAG: glycosyltransferase family 1 protein [Flavobacteriaceae bacterium]